jgi:hypothetical protein
MDSPYSVNSMAVNFGLLSWKRLGLRHMAATLTSSVGID